jgi:hypothetical protein
MRSSKLSPEIIESSKKLLTLMGIPYVEAKGEGEAQAAYLVANGDAYAVASQDYDCLLFGAKRVVRNLAINSNLGNLEFYELNRVLRELNITREELEAVIAHDRGIAYDGLFKNLAIENVRSRYQTDPIEVVCPEVYPRRKTIIYRYFKKDSKVYYSQIGYSWLLFGEKSLYYYHASVNHIYGYVGHEVSCEFDYKDIVSLQTDTTHENGVESLVLSISLVNGEVLDIALRTRPNRVYGSTHQLSEKEAQVISTIRNVVRNSK